MKKRGTESWEVGGRPLLLHHLDKVYWPREKGEGGKVFPSRTKGDMCRYYREVYPFLSPYLAERPVTFRVFPEGIHGFNYYRRSMPDKAPDWIKWTPYEAETRERTLHLPLLQDLASLLWFADKAAIELHLWGARLPRLNHPDLAIFDLDLGKGVPFERVMEAALSLRELLEGEGVKSFPKTSGGTGMHVYVPLKGGRSFEEVREWVKGMGEVLARKHPKLVVPAKGKTHAGPRVTVDYAQNSKGRNTAAPYTLRARPGAPVSTPLDWAEVERGGIDPRDFHIATVPRRLKERGDPWEGLGLNARG